MGGFFGAISKRDVVLDIFFGADYHSHLGTRRGGIAAFDADGDKIGTVIHDCEIFPVARLSELCKRLQVKIGIICVPAPFAQEVADDLVAGGVKAIWNFANVALKVPDSVIVQREVIAGGLALLSVKLNSQNYDIN